MMDSGLFGWFFSDTKIGDFSTTTLSIHTHIICYYRGIFKWIAQFRVQSQV
jgi:hypothetical protein